MSHSGSGWIRGRTASCAVLFSLLAALVVGSAGSAAAEPRVPVPPREDTNKRTVLFIHGYQPLGSADCDSWKSTKEHFIKKGWKRDRLISWGWYAKDTNCDVTRPFGRDDSLEDIAEDLREYITENFGEKGETVDVVTHSTGGLLIRNAIIRAREKDSRTYVEDVVNVAAPHKGSPVAYGCQYTQCEELRPGSAYLRGLERASSPEKRFHEAEGGTDYTLMGSAWDVVVPRGSALGLYAKHHFYYTFWAGIRHETYFDFPVDEPRPTPMRYSHDHGESWTNQQNAFPPLFHVENAAFLHEDS